MDQICQKYSKELHQQPGIEQLFQKLSARMGDIGDFFQPDCCDFISTQKAATSKILKDFQKQDKLADDNFSVDGISDYGVILGPIKGGEAQIYKVYEKRVPLNKRIFKALRRIECLLTNKANVIRELELLSEIDHENVIRLEKVFCKYNDISETLIVNMLMPWMHDTFKSWLMKSKNSLDIDFDISKCKRSLSEVRNMFNSILCGVSVIHEHKCVHLDLNFNNIFVTQSLAKDFFNDTQIDSFVTFKAVIGDFGLGQFLNRLSSRAGGTIGFLAPEILEYMNDQENLTKDECITLKADVYSIGAMLYKLFVDGRIRINEALITPENVRKRITKYFLKSGEALDDEILQDITNTIKECLNNDPKLRPDTNNLLSRKFFQKATIPHEIDVENAFEHGLMLLEQSPIMQSDARRIFDHLTSKGHAMSKLLLGWMTELGYGGKMDRKLGKETVAKTTAENYDLMKKKAEEGNDWFEFFVGRNHYYGAGIPEDFPQAIYFTKKALQHNNTFAMDFMGVILQNGNRSLKIEKNPIEGMDLFKKAAELGNSQSIFHAGSSYVSKGDFKNALEYYMKSSDLGCTTTWACLGMMHLAGKGVEKDFEKALEYLEKSVSMGNPLGMLNLGCCYLSGSGVAKDLKKYYSLTQTAADLGEPIAVSNLGECYESGIGVEKDIHTAIELYEKSCELGCGLGYLNLGLIYLDGVGGIEKDVTRAIQYLEKAGIEASLKKLVELYTEGNVVPQNLEFAKQYSSKLERNEYEQRNFIIDK